MNLSFSFEPKLYRNPYPGFYLVLEGIDGSGKSVQAGRLASYFQERGKETLVTHEPRKDAGVLADVTNKILQGNGDMPAASYQYLFSAERIMHHQEVIIPALKSGKTVVSDRSFWSAIPYGVLDLATIDMPKVAKEILIAHGMPFIQGQTILPSMTVYLDVSVETGLARLPAKEHERHEIYETESKLKKAKEGYEWLLKEFPDEFISVDAEGSIDEVFEKIVLSIKY